MKYSCVKTKLIVIFWNTPSIASGIAKNEELKGIVQMQNTWKVSGRCWTGGVSSEK